MNYLQATKETRPFKLTAPLASMSVEGLVKGMKTYFECELKSINQTFIYDDNIGAAMEKAADWILDNDNDGLLLYGRPGTGKTLLMKSINQMIRVTRSLSLDMKLVTAHEIYSEFRTDEGRESIRAYSSVPVLSIDDLGCEPERCCIYGVDYTPIQQILYNRYNHRAPTVITTNLNLQDIKARRKVELNLEDMTYEEVLAFIAKSLGALSKRNDVSRIISFIRKQEEEILTPMRNDMAAMKTIFSQLLDTIKTI